VLVLGYDALEVEFAALLKERDSRNLDVIGVDNWWQSTTDNPPQSMLAIQQRFAPLHPCPECRRSSHKAWFTSSE